MNDGERLNAETAYLFRHALLRDAAYQLQLPGDRARLHAQAFEALERLAGGRAPAPLPADEPSDFRPHASDTFARELAEHARHSGRGDLRPVYLACLRRAAEHAERHFRNAEAIELWGELASSVEGEAGCGASRRAGVLAAKTGRTADAEAHLARSLALARRGGLRGAEGLALGNLASVYAETGRPEAAESAHREALGIHRALGDRRHEANVLGNLANLEHNTGRHVAAEAHHREAIAMHRELGARRVLGIELGNLANLLTDLKRLEEGEALFEEALGIHHACSDRYSEGITRINVAVLYRQTGRFDLAESSYGRAIAIHEEGGDRRSLGYALSNLANLHLRRGRYDLAEDLARRALTLTREVGDPHAESLAHGVLAHVFWSTKRFPLAVESFDQACSRARDAGSRHLESLHLADAALCLVAQGCRKEAGARWQAAAALMRENGNQEDLKSYMEELRRACERAGMPVLEAGQSCS